MNDISQDDDSQYNNDTSRMLSSPAFASCFPITPYTPRYSANESYAMVASPRGLVISLQQSPPLSILGSPTSTDNELDTTRTSEGFFNILSPPLSIPASVDSSHSSQSLPSNLESSKNLDEESGMPTGTSASQSPCSNEPNQMLETPSLYFLVKKYPRIMNIMQRFYKFRWAATYPLQNRVGRFGIKPQYDMTWGEVLFILPFFATIISATVYTFAVPSITATGHCCRLPLIFCFLTAMKNSFVTFLLGIPFNRTLFYHKLSGRIAFINSLLHMLVAFLHPNKASVEGTSFLAFLGLDTVHTAGTLLLIFMASLLVTSTPIVRQKAYEIFYYLHILYAAAMMGCAFYHSGILVPILGSICWCSDMIVRKGVMAAARYPKNATIRIISDSVVEICFPKCQRFDYNPGQYILVAVPELSMFQWHPFSISSSPCQKMVTLHIRKAGNWTAALYNLAKKTSSIRILIEGPYGSLGVDLLTSERYKMIMLVSGGTGVAPMQSICNQVVYEQSKGIHEPIKRLSFVWTERDPAIMSENTVVRRASMSTVGMESNQERHVKGPASPTLLQLTEGEPMGIASIMLALVPASSATDEELDVLYPIASEEVDDAGTNSLEEREVSSNSATAADDCDEYKHGSPGLSTDCSDDDTILDKAYCPTSENREFLDLKVFLTSNSTNPAISDLPFVHRGRPNVYQLLRSMKEEAIHLGEKRVAVCACAPEPLVKACRWACAKLSDRNVQFDLHEETFT